ncbi:MAG TPA: PAS domain-containing protein [Rhizomicrobium sp.]
METQALGFVLERSPRRQNHLEHSIAEMERTANPSALSLIDAWGKSQARGGMVMGRDFPSRRFAGLLPNILLLEKLERVRDFRVRLAGFGMLCFYGFDPSGRRLGEIFEGEKHKARCNVLCRVLRCHRPGMALSRLSQDGETFLEREIVCLPVLAFDARTPLVLVASFWNRRWLN